ncbi:MAG: GNAT family N-acetyltransferase [Pseudomonadota bacterium]
MILRPTTPKDLAAIDLLLARSYRALLKRDYPASVLVTALPLISRAQPDLLSSGTYYVVTDEVRVYGAGGWSRDRDRSDLGHIRHLVTDHLCLRRGIARCIVLHALQDAGQAGIRQMECWSTFTAEPFYKAMGFTTQGPIDVPLQPGVSFPARRMIRSLQ